jgi:hypothetical protein
MLYSSPFFVQWKRTEAKSFQLERVKAYRNSAPFPSEVWEYSRPVISLNKTKKPSYTLSQASVSEMMDLKLVATLGLSMGKVTHNLFGENLYKAIIQCGRHQNPFEAYSTGGYSVKTQWRSAAAVSSETISLVENLYWNLDKIHYYMNSRRDTEPFSFNKKEFYQIQGYKRSLEGVKYPNWGGTPAGKERNDTGHLVHKKVRYEDLLFLDPCESKGSIVRPCSDVLTDLKNRFNDSLDSEAFNFEAEECLSEDFESEVEDIDDSIYDTLVYEE